MNLLFSCIGRRGSIADYFRKHLNSSDMIIGTSNTELTPGFNSCDKAFVMPSIKDEDYLTKFLELCKKEKIDAVLSFFDLDIEKISKIREDLEKEGITPIFPDSNVSKICFDKFETHEFLKNNGFNSPQTYIDLELAIEDIEKEKLSFPLIVKPRFGFGSKHLFVARNMEELKIFFKYGPDMIVQEFMEGQEYGYDILNDLNGKALSCVVRKKYSMRSGETDQAITVKSKKLVKEGINLANSLKNIGPLDVDFFVHNEKVFILEMNPRFGGGYPLSQLAGADFPSLICKMIKGEKLEPINDYKEGVVMMKDYKILNGLNKDVAIFQTKIDGD